MNVAIVTIFGNFNYGNRLQNYALQTILEQLGNSTMSIAVSKDSWRIKRIIKTFYEKKHNRWTYKGISEIKRQYNFDRFNEKYIHYKKIFNNTGYIPDIINNDYDCFIAGSDQIWNPVFWENDDNSFELHNYLLKFAYKKKISYAASFGINKLSEQWKKRMLPSIADFDFISVREDSGKALLEEEGIEAACVLDPTLLLSAEEWRKMECNCVSDDQEYILTYFLGAIEQQNNEYIQNLSKKYNLKLIELMNEQCEYYTESPEIFIELIHKAKVIFTDSFHATAFSIIFHKPFVVYGRNHKNKTNMNDRIFSLLSKLNLSERFNYRGYALACDYSNVDEKLKILQNNSIEFLRRSLEL